MRGFHILVMMVIGDSVKDTQCGFKVTACIYSCFQSALVLRVFTKL